MNLIGRDKVTGDEWLMAEDVGENAAKEDKRLAEQQANNPNLIFALTHQPWPRCKACHAPERRIARVYLCTDIRCPMAPSPQMLARLRRGEVRRALAHERGER